MNRLTKLTLSRPLVISVVGVLSVIYFVTAVSVQYVAAVSASNWAAGRIIDDPLFTSPGDMSVSDIQNFLNGLVPNCDSTGQGILEPGYYAPDYNKDGRVTHAEYAQYRGYGTNYTFTCLRDYYEVPKTAPSTTMPASNYGGAPIPPNAISAAQIISNAAYKYNISPRTLLVKLATESPGPLTTDSWPFPRQFTYAMGAHCPDSGPGGTANCDANYAGFSIQVDEAASLLRWYLNSMNQSWWPYKRPYQNNSILWNVTESGCGGSTVYIETMATAALYTYTPYQPNQAALNNMYGTGDACSAYGNRNFWRVWNDWFGPTVDSRLFYRVIQGNASGEVYLQTASGKYYVPSYSLLAEWGMYPSDVVAIPQTVANSIPTRGTLSTSLTDGSGNLYVVEGGSTHKVLSPTFTSLWNVDTSSIVESLGLVKSLVQKEPLNRFVTQRGGDGSVWLVNTTQRHPVSGGMLYSWGYYPGAVTTVSPYLFSRFTDGSPVTQYANLSSDPTAVWAIDASQKRAFKDTATKNAYLGQAAPTTVSSAVLDALTTGETLTRFSVEGSSGHWFMVDTGNKYYIPRGELATLWGKPTGSPSVLSANFLAHIPSNGNLGVIASSSTTGQYWYVAKEKHYIKDSGILQAISGSTAAPTAYSEELLSQLTRGADVSYSVTGMYSPYNYSYVLDKGTRRYPASAAAQQAWIYQPMALPSEAMMLLPEGSFINSMVTDGSSYIYVEDGNRYTIDSKYLLNWDKNAQNTPLVSTETLTRLNNAGSLSDVIVTPSNSIYVVSQGRKQPINTHKDAYSPALPAITPSTNPSPTAIGIPNATTEASYLATTTEAPGSSYWLITNGAKLSLTFEQAVAFGYLSRNITLTQLSNETLSKITTSNQSYSSLVQKTGSGLKFLNFGAALGFPDSPTLIAYTPTSSGSLVVSASIFDNLPLSANASRLVYDDAGRYWWIENGTRRYITSWQIYAQRGYPANIPARYLYGITMNQLPTGSPIQ